MVVYTWWCWHICKGEEVGEVLEALELKKEKGWLLNWKIVLIHYALDQVFMWVVYPSE
jgi:hypothetical protein